MKMEENSNFLKELALKRNGKHSYFEKNDYEELFEILEKSIDVADCCVFTNNAAALLELIKDEAKCNTYFSKFDCFLNIIVSDAKTVTLIDSETNDCTEKQHKRLVYVQNYYLLDYSEQRKLISDMVQPKDPLIKKVLPSPLINTNYIRQNNDRVLFVAELKEDFLNDIDYSIKYKINSVYYLHF
jgi:hypothetical protein